MTPAYLPMCDQQLLDGLPLAGGGIKDGLHVQLLQVLMLLVPPAPEERVHTFWWTCVQY